MDKTKNLNNFIDREHCDDVIDIPINPEAEIAREKQARNVRVLVCMRRLKAKDARKKL